MFVSNDTMWSLCVLLCDTWHCWRWTREVSSLRACCPTELLDTIEQWPSEGIVPQDLWVSLSPINVGRVIVFLLWLNQRPSPHRQWAHISSRSPFQMISDLLDHQQGHRLHHAAISSPIHS